VRPAPLITEDSDGFWSAAASGTLVVQRCSSCGRYQHPPRPMCPDCHSTSQEWVEAAGTGTVYSYAVLHHPQHPRFSYPLIAALVDLDEGVRLVTNLVEIEPADVAIGMPVEVTFLPTEGDGAVAVFRPRAR